MDCHGAGSRSRTSVGSITGLVVATLGIAACQDLFAPPAKVPVQFSVTLARPSGAAGDDLAAYNAVDGLDLLILFDEAAQFGDTEIDGFYFEDLPIRRDADGLGGIVTIPLPDDARPVELWARLTSKGTGLFFADDTVLAREGAEVVATPKLQPLASRIVVDANEVVVRVGQTARIPVIMLYANGDTIRAVSPDWTYDRSLVTIDAAGNVTGVRVGTTTVTAESENLVITKDEGTFDAEFVPVSASVRVRVTN